MSAFSLNSFYLFKWIWNVPKINMNTLYTHEHILTATITSHQDIVPISCDITHIRVVQLILSCPSSVPLILSCPSSCPPTVIHNTPSIERPSEVVVTPSTQKHYNLYTHASISQQGGQSPTHERMRFHVQQYAMTHASTWTYILQCRSTSRVGQRREEREKKTSIIFPRF